MRKDTSGSAEPQPLEIVIGEDGRVVFRTVTRDSVELAEALAPQDQKVKTLAKRLGRRREEKRE